VNACRATTVPVIPAPLSLTYLRYMSRFIKTLAADESADKDVSAQFAENELFGDGSGY